MTRGRRLRLLLVALYVAAFAVSVALYGSSAERLGILSAGFAVAAVLLWWPWRR
jgi:hypothetical protein